MTPDLFRAFGEALFGARWHADMGRLIGKHRTAVWHYDSGRYKPEDSNVYLLIEAAAVDRVMTLNALLKSTSRAG